MHDVMIVGYGPTGMLAAVLLGRAGHIVCGVRALRHNSTTCRASASCTTTCCACSRKSASATRSQPSTFFLPIYELANKGRILLCNNVQPRPRMAGPNSSRSTSRHSRPSSTGSRRAARRSSCSRAKRRRHRAGRRQRHCSPSRTGIGECASSADASLSDATAATASCAALSASSSSSSASTRTGWSSTPGRREPRPDLPYLRQFCEPAQPGMTMQMGADHRRWSFMIFPGEPHDGSDAARKTSGAASRAAKAARPTSSS